MRSYRTAASLLATLLGDVEMLDSTSLLRGGQIGSLCERNSSWWSDLLAVRFSDVVHPSLRYEVEALLGSCDNDWMALLANSAKQAQGDPHAALSVSRFPLMMFAGSDGSGQVCLDRQEVADSHLHSGGSMPIGVLVSGLATRTSPIAIRDRKRRREAEDVSVSGVRLVTADGRTWDALVLLAAARWALRLLWYVSAGGDVADAQRLESRGLTLELVTAVSDKWFWNEVKNLATIEVKDPATDEAEVEARLARLNCAFPDNGRCPDLSDLIDSWNRASPLGAPASENFLLSTIRALTAIGSMAASIPGEGLTTFSSRFRRMAQIQKVVLGRRNKGPLAIWSQALVAETIEQVAPSSQVVAAEFRKTFKGTNSATLREEIRRELAIHNVAFAGFARFDHEMSLTMPVTFDRDPTPSLNPAEAAPSELGHVLGVCQALIEIAGDPGGRQLIDAIWSTDVAGPEIGSANWPFLFGAQMLADAKVPLTFTIHAGESFVSELNGVRRVGELFMGKVHPRRIGHALALSERACAAVLSRGRPPINRAEAIVDVAWLWHVTGSDAAFDLLGDLVRRERPHRAIAPDDWIEAFQMLYDEKEVERRLLFDTGMKRQLRSTEVRVAEAHGGDPVDRAFAALSWAAPPELAGCDVRSKLSSEELAEYDAVSRDEAPAAREHVLGLIREEKVIVESCPTSNVMLSGMSSYREHPFWDWSDKGLDVTVSSDDPLQFGSNVLRELQALLASGGDDAAVRQAAAESVASCSGGSGRRLAGWTGYNEIVELIGDRQVPALSRE